MINMDFEIDFSLIQWIEIRKLGISMDEVYDVFKNPNSSITSLLGESFAVGFTTKKESLSWFLIE
jgi:hypothetical protein